MLARVRAVKQHWHELFFPLKYISLENLDLRQQAAEDPRGFFQDHGQYLILDEVQRVPELFPYLQELVDARQDPAQYILTGSSQFLLLEDITQSLAGRIITFKLFPLTYTELYEYPADSNFESIFRIKHSHRSKLNQDTLHQLIWQGFYPRIHDKHIDSYRWYENYLLTYVERDVRNLLKVKNLRLFSNFLKRDQSGNEVDLLIHDGLSSFPIEFKLSRSYHSDLKKGIERWLALEKNPAKSGFLVYCGEHSLQINAAVPTVPWYVL